MSRSAAVATSLHPDERIKASDVPEIDELCHKVIRASVGRGGWVPVDDNTPLDELLRVTAGGEEQRDESAARRETIMVFLQWLVSAGPVPAQVMRRVYAAIHTIAPELLCHMTGADVALMLGETKAAHSWRTLKLFEGKVHARSMKRALARMRYRDAQMGNTSRKKGAARQEAQQRRRRKL